MNQPGRMKLLLISLHFSSLCTLSSWSVSWTPTNVRQAEDIDVFEGEAVNISCCWTGMFSRIRVQWFKNQTTHDSLLTEKNQENQTHEMEKCSFWKFDSIKKQDSGRYVCKIFIEIPLLVQVTGNGTIITVKTRENQTDTTPASHPPESLLVPIVASVVVPLLLLITFAYFCCLRKNQGSGGAARVIHESPYTNSDLMDMEMDKQSTSSSIGSSQWCQVPVYDSLDYFEHVENKGSE